MIYVHKKNLETKINTDYKKLKKEIQEFYKNEYLPVNEKLKSINFCDETKKSIEDAAKIFNEYYDKLKKFSSEHKISFQSKFESTFLEEMSCYLFQNLPQINDGTLGIFNKKIFAGLKINEDGTVEIINKDVDFCIGKKIKFSIDNQSEKEIVLPVVAVEVKTFLDATMLGEVRSSSRAIKNASPTAKTYVLMGYRSLAETHIVDVRNDSALTEMFALRKNANDPMSAEVLYEYWQEVVNSIEMVYNKNNVNLTGRLLH